MSYQLQNLQYFTTLTTTGLRYLTIRYQVPHVNYLREVGQQVIQPLFQEGLKLIIFKHCWLKIQLGLSCNCTVTKRKQKPC